MKNFIIIAAMAWTMFNIAQASEALKGVCYTAYQLEQEILLTSTFASTVKTNRVKFNNQIHVKEVPVPDAIQNNIELLPSYSAAKSFIFLVSSPNSGADGVADFAPPFLVVVEQATGKLISLESNIDDSTVQNQNLNYYDLFQYSNTSGKFQYRNANGEYLSDIKLDLDTNEIQKKNKRYLPSLSSANITILDSQLVYKLEQNEDHCFFKSAVGTDVISHSLTSDTLIDVDASINVHVDPDLALDDGHFFHQLSNDTSQWPTTNKNVKTISRIEALERLPNFINILSMLTDNKDDFFEGVARQALLWPYLSEYLLSQTIPDDVSRLLFLSLDRLDSPVSVSALTQLAISHLNPKDAFRVSIALGSTDATIDDESLNNLLRHVSELDSLAELPSEQLVLIRMLGAMTQSRLNKNPLQSGKIKQFIYSQVDSQTPEKQLAVIDAIGNLGNAIDSTGQAILLEKASAASPDQRRAAAAAFARLPYEVAMEPAIIERMNQETDTQVQQAWLQVLSNADSSNLAIKAQLIDRIKHKQLGTQALMSLKTIDYRYSNDEIHKFELTLKNESNPQRQQLLASLILKHRRQLN